MTEAVAPAWARALTDGWGAVFDAAPRHLFLPPVIWPLDPRTGEYHVVDRARDPDAWRRWAASDAAIVTQWDDGEHAGPAPGAVPTSSASVPSLVADMLNDLDVHPGHAVLDVGAGTGWTTGLLTIRTGPGLVTAVEIDPGAAEDARERLRAAGLDATVITGDGRDGRLTGAPYDRVQVTYAVREISPAWIAQTRPGGVIVAPWTSGFGNGGAVVRLVVGDDGAAGGRFTRPAEFMVDRRARGTWPVHAAYMPEGQWPPGTVESATLIDPGDIWSDPVAEFAVGLRVPSLVHTEDISGDGETVSWLYSLTDRSWAVVFAGDEAEHEVYQGGHRRLWDAVESAFQWWHGEGRPEYDRFGLTVHPGGGEAAWLDSPNNAI